MELLVSTRKRRPVRCSVSMNSLAPGIGCCSCTRTPSMSVSQQETDLGSVMEPGCQPRGEVVTRPCGADELAVAGGHTVIDQLPTSSVKEEHPCRTRPTSTPARPR